MVLLFTIHALNYFSALLHILLGILILKRNKSNHISQLLAGTFFGLGVYQFFDGLIITVQIDFPGWLDLIRDLSTITLILSAEFAFLAILIVMFGEQKVFNRINFIWWPLLNIIVLYLGITGDHIIRAGPNKNNGFHLDIARSLMGWITITGTLVILSTITIIIFLIQIHKSRGKFRSKTFYFIFGYALIILNILIFDLAVFIELLNSLIANNVFFHVNIHFFLITGEILVISTLISPLRSDYSHINFKIEKKSMLTPEI